MMRNVLLRTINRAWPAMRCALALVAIALHVAQFARADDRTPPRRLNTSTAQAPTPLPASSATKTPTKTAAKSVAHADQLTLRFKTSPTVDSQVVRLGDLIEVTSWGNRAQEDILQVALGPAPQFGNHQDWTADDLLRNLDARGIDKRKVTWHGPETVRLMRQRDGDTAKHAAVTGASETSSKKLTPAFLSDRLLAQAEANLIQATREYLWLQTNERTPWRIELKVPVEVASELAQRRNILSLGGGAAPWTGPQRLVYLIKHQGEEFELSMTVHIELPMQVVVASRAIRRDEVIDESCLTYAPLPEQLEGQEGLYFEDMADLIGKQIRKAVTTGVPVPRASIGEPNVISTGELIEIESVSGGIVVKSAAKALNGGAVGELINVELIPSRKRLAATVVGPMQVRITGKSAVRGAPSAPETTDKAPAPLKTAGKLQAPGGLRR